MKASLAAAAALLTFAGACSHASPGVSNAPTLRIVTGLYPLEAAIREIGQNKVSVTDIVPAGADPRTYQPTPADVAEIRRADLVVEAPDGFQPEIQRAAGQARRVWALPPSDRYGWLDPVAMQGVTARITDELAQANPAAASYYRSGQEAFGAELRSTGIDYSSTLSACPISVLFTAGSAFAPVMARYGLRDHPLGTVATPSAVAAGVAAVGDSDATTVFGETWEPVTVVRAVASQTGRKLRSLDTLLGPPHGGWPAGATYINLLEANLGAISRALGCPDQTT